MARGLASEIVLIDINHDRAEGEAMDLNHALSFVQPARIWAGDYPDAADADIVLIAAGVAQKAGETRLSLAKTNVAIIRDSPIDASMISIPNMANLSVYIYLRVLPVNVMP